MLEVGKKYKEIHSGKILECLYNGNTLSFMREIKSGVEFTTDNFHIYTEYKEPIKKIGYLNLYSDLTNIYLYPSRTAADFASRGSTCRIGCIRVELTEGQWDD